MRTSARASTVLAILLLAIATTVGAEAPSAPSPPPMGAPFAVEGIVKSSEGKPVAGATVRVRGVLAESDETRAQKEAPPKPVLARTDAAGRFKVEGIRGHHFYVRVEAQGLAPYNSKKTEPGTSVEVVLTRGTSVTGRVLGEADKRPIAGATVWARESSNSFGEEACRRATSDENGRFVIVDLPAERLTLEALAPGKARGRQEVSVALPVEGASSAPETSVFLRPGGRLSGHVVGQDGKPLEGVGLVLLPQSLSSVFRGQGNLPEKVYSDASGRFAFEGIPAGLSYRLHSDKTGLPQKLLGPYVVEPGSDRSDVEVRLEEGATLKVRLVDADGRGIDAMSIDMEDADPKARPGSLFDGSAANRDQIPSEGEGRFLVKALRPGTYRIRLLPDEFMDVERSNVRLRAGETVDLGTVTVREGHRLSGTVKDAAGKGIQGASIRGAWEDQGKFRSRTVTSKAGGRFRLGGLAEAGTLRMVTVSAKGFSSWDRQAVDPSAGPLEVVLERGGGVTGRVLLPGGEPASEFTIDLHPEAKESEGAFSMRRLMRRGEIHRIFTEPSGSFTVDGVPPGEYTVEASTPTHAPAKKSGVAIAADQKEDVGSLTLKEGLRVQGRILAAKDDLPITGAAVQVGTPRAFPLRVFGSGGGRGAISGADGSFAVEGLEVGTYSVTAEHPDYARGEGRIEVQAEQPTPDVVVKLSRGGTLAGTVRDAQRQPVEGAGLVVLQNFGMGEMRDAITGTDGRYQVDRLTPGTYQAMRIPEGARIVFGEGMKSASVKEGETTILDFEETAKISLEGRVLRSGEPVPNATLIFTQGDPNAVPSQLKMAQSEADGSYKIGLDTSGPYKVMVQNAGLGGGGGATGVDLAVPDEPEVRLDILLKAAGIQGTVTDEEGQPLAEVWVQASRDGAPSDAFDARVVAQTDTSGTYSLQSLNAGTYRVTATATGYRNAEAYPITVADEQPPSRVDLQLARGRTVRGRVLDPQGRGLEGALIFAGPSGTSSGVSFFPGSTDFNGSFEITAPSDGAIDLTAYAEGWAPSRLVGVEPPAEGEGSELNLRVRSGGRIRARVVDGRGQALAGESILARPQPPFLGSDFALFGRRVPPTGADGTTVIDLLSPASYEVSIPGRKGVAPAIISVGEGDEATVTLQVP